MLARQTISSRDDLSAECIQALWLRARSEDSNLALDWLWLYTVLADDGQRLLCLRKALAIDPDNTTVRRLLARLEHSVGRYAAPQNQPCTEG